MEPVFVFLPLSLVFCIVPLAAQKAEPHLNDGASDPIQELKQHLKRLEERLDDQEHAFRMKESHFAAQIKELTLKTEKCENDLKQQKDLLTSLAVEMTKQKMTMSRAVPVTYTGQQEKSSMVSGYSSWDEIGTSVFADEDLHLEKKSDDLGFLEPVVNQLSQRLAEMTVDIQALKTNDSQLDTAIAAQAKALGTTYVRWGNPSCPASVETVYSSQMGGSWFDHPGAAVNYLCLAPNPVFDGKPLPSRHAFLYGSEYDTHSENNVQENAVCAVCRIPRTSTVMIPGTNVCSSGWTLEYFGYLMAGIPTGYAAASEYICVDKSENFVPGTQANDNGKLLLYTATQCGSLPCPPYINNSVVLCAVCSK